MALIHNTNYMDADYDEPEEYDDEEPEEDLYLFAEYDDESTTCPMCEGEGVPLGALGNLNWYRCRNCGMDYCIGNN